MITITALRWVPPFLQGLVRDLRVRWALEEASLPYQEHLVSAAEKNTADYRAQMQPFAQIPVYREGDVVLFESGAIVLHIAERSEALLPKEPAARARAITWLFAAIDSVEPKVQNLAAIDQFFANEEWAKLRRPAQYEETRARLQQLSDWLEGRDYLDGSFSVADLTMTAILANLRDCDLMSKLPVLAAYQKRCEARPAFQRALASQMAAFARNAPAA